MRKSKSRPNPRKYLNFLHKTPANEPAGVRPAHTTPRSSQLLAVWIPKSRNNFGGHFERESRYPPLSPARISSTPRPLIARVGDRSARSNFSWPSPNFPRLQPSILSGETTSCSRIKLRANNSELLSSTFELSTSMLLVPFDFCIFTYTY